MKKFWLVWNGNNLCMPVVQHPNESSARNEAERLARLNRGTNFFVLESIDACKLTDIVWANGDPMEHF